MVTGKKELQRMCDMNSPKPTEPKFEKHIEDSVGLGYQSEQSQNYDKPLCLTDMI